MSARILATCFLIGGLAAQHTSNARSISVIVCQDTAVEKNDTIKWCDYRNMRETNNDLPVTDMVFAFHISLLDYSRWQLKLIGVLQVDIEYQSQIEVKPSDIITIDARLWYRNIGDPEDDWKMYAQSTEKRHISSKADGVIASCNTINIDAIPLFEFGSLTHAYYLLNLRFPVDTSNINSFKISPKGLIKNMWLTVINQNGSLNKVYLFLKTLFFNSIVWILVWFWKTLHKLQRKPVLLEKMLMCLGLVLCLLNIPIEYLALFLDIPSMSLLENIRQDLFYAALFLFWFVYVGEHRLILDGSAQSSAKQYCWHSVAVIMGGVSLLIYDIYVEGIKLFNPFYYMLDIEIYLTLSFTILAGSYFLFLCYMIFQIFIKISLPIIVSEKCLHDLGVLYRVMFLMLNTLVCVILTVTRIILGQVAVNRWKWDRNIGPDYISVFFIGVYGTWNIYIFVLLFLYAPPEANSLRHRVWGQQDLKRSSTIANLHQRQTVDQMRK